ncbi:hypothetical protein EDC94DRAFT_526435, partial [Helicostylum pulchrum]
RRKKEADTTDMEMARMNAPISKEAGGQVKLLVGSKYVLGRLLNESSEDHLKVVAPALQIMGDKAELYSFKLFVSGLYVAVTEGEATIPNSIEKK